ncbi:hypothetical protein ACWD46_08045 [Streptomyces sp. NPDC002486]
MRGADSGAGSPAVAQVQGVRVHGRRLRHETALAQAHLSGPREQPLLPLLPRRALPVGGCPAKSQGQWPKRLSSSDGWLT